MIYKITKQCLTDGQAVNFLLLCPTNLSKRAFLAPIVISAHVLAILNFVVFAFLLGNKSTFFLWNIGTDLPWNLFAVFNWYLLRNGVAFISRNSTANISWLGNAILTRYRFANLLWNLSTYILANLGWNFFTFGARDIMTCFSRDFSASFFGYLNRDSSAYVLHNICTLLAINLSWDFLWDTSWDIFAFFSWHNSALTLRDLAWNMSCNCLALVLRDWLTYLAWNLFCNFDTCSFRSIRADLSRDGSRNLSWNFSTFCPLFFRASWNRNSLAKWFLYFSTLRSTNWGCLRYSVRILNKIICW